MCLTLDGQYLISGDAVGHIYIWNMEKIDPQSGMPKLKLFDLHKPKNGKEGSAITNLIPINRPLNLFGLKANMKNYQPLEVGQFQK
jgi:hypothetical protein